MTFDPAHIDWIALGAIATVLLAGATVWLGWQTRDVSLKTGTLVATTADEMDLLRQQAAAMRDLADNTKAELEELRETRFAEFLPMLRWQSPQLTRAYRGNHEFWAVVTVVLRNEGPGPARILGVTLDGGADLYVQGSLDQPSTLPAGEPISFSARSEPPITDASAAEHPIRQLAVRIRYGDLFGEFEYETLARFQLNIAPTTTQAVRVGFVDSDERSALERRITKRTGDSGQA